MCARFLHACACAYLRVHEPVRVRVRIRVRVHIMCASVRAHMRMGHSDIIMYCAPLWCSFKSQSMRKRIV